MIIRNAKADDLKMIAEVERTCFPEAEAATEDEFEERIRYYGNHFWLLFEDNRLIAFVDGFVSDKRDLEDEMYEKAYMHNENGKWQMVFGVNTVPEYQHNGYASLLLRRMIKDAKDNGRFGVVLTCKKELIGFYEQFGFINEGISSSVHGNVIWYQMRLTF